MSSDLYFLVPESFHKNLVQIGKVVFEKIPFEFLYVHDLGQRSINDLDLQYSHTFMKSISCLYLHTKFRGNRPAGSGEEDFLRFLPYMGMAAILVM